MAQKVLITPKSFNKYKDVPVQLLEAAGYEVVLNETGKTLTAEDIIAAAASDVAGIIVGVDPITAEVLDACADLKAVSKYGVGMDNIDLEHCAKIGVKVQNAQGTNSLSVAELSVGLMFEAARAISAHVATVRGGGWGRSMGVELTGKKVGIVGGGQIGRAVAQRCVGLQMDVGIYDPFLADTTFLTENGIRHVENLDEIFTDSDFISLHLPVTDSTRHMVNAERLASMKSSAVLVNTARGELVDEDALLTALQNGEIAFAAQDVFSEEPPRANHPLLALENFVLTPHLGAFTAEAVERMAITSTKNLLDMLGAGETHE